MKFNYQARTKDGEIQSGSVEASSRNAALLLLQKNNLFVTFLEEEKPLFFAKGASSFRRVSKRDLVIFSRQLAIMFKSNIPVVESLESLAKQTTSKAFQEKIYHVSEKVEGGTTLSQALSSYPEIFSNFYIGIVKSGEVSGKLAESLEYLADHLEREYGFYSKITTAMVYPLFIFFIFIAALIAMSIFILPELSGILLESGQELPFLTILVISISDFVRNFWWLVIILIVALVFGFFSALRIKSTRKTIDKISLKLPFFGAFLKKIYFYRLAESLSTLIISGLPISQALEVTADIIGNDAYKNIVLKVRDGVRQGESITSVLIKYPDFFSPLFVQMTSVGERTGQIESSLVNVVTFYRREVEKSLDVFVSMLEPLIIICLGVLVGGLVISILLPIYQIAMGVV